MPMYAFTPIDLLPPPPTAPGTDFQDLAAASLGDADAADAALITSFAAASTNLVSDLADLADIGSLIVSAGVELDALIAEDTADDLLTAIAAAAAQDQALASVGADVAGAALSLTPNLLAALLQPLYSSLGGVIQVLVNNAVVPIWGEIQILEYQMQEFLGGAGYGGF